MLAPDSEKREWKEKDMYEKGTSTFSKCHKVGPSAMLT
jgi:hypothetical protein